MCQRCINKICTIKIIYNNISLGRFLNLIIINGGSEGGLGRGGGINLSQLSGPTTKAEQRAGRKLLK